LIFLRFRVIFLHKSAPLINMDDISPAEIFRVTEGFLYLHIYFVCCGHELASSTLADVGRYVSFMDSTIHTPACLLVAFLS
jgi:hypothetical protein